MGMMVTLKDVTKHARVSVTSASYALNGTGTISAATRQCILETADKLNYHPNAFARNLKKPKTSTIGVFITRCGNHLPNTATWLKTQSYYFKLNIKPDITVKIWT